MHTHRPQARPSTEQIVDGAKVRLAGIAAELNKSIPREDTIAVLAETLCDRVRASMPREHAVDYLYGLSELMARRR